MSSFEKIQKACKSINLPAYPDFNIKNEDTYVVYNFASEVPANFGDDAPQSIIADLQAHLYLPANQNFFDIKSKLVNALFQQGFTYPSVALNTAEENNTVRHIVLEFEDDIDI